MPTHALFIRHTTLPGKCPEVQRIWQQHLQPAIAANDGHLAYFYCFGDHPDAIYAFQQYESAEAARVFLTTSAYEAYVADVTPLLDGEPEIQILDVQWAKT